MTPMFDCLVSYFGLGENGRPGFGRYFCYHILAGPGPTAGAGLAVVRVLAVHSDTDRCDSWQEHFHTAEAGGPAAAMPAAVRHPGAYHEEDHVRKVQSRVRGDQSTDAVPFPGTQFPGSPGVPAGRG